MQKQRMPALFIGHGSPMNAITDNPFSIAWSEIGGGMPKPRAVLCISAHWETDAPTLCTADPPQTIHDFRGFPSELFAVSYPAPGTPELAQAVQALLGPDSVTLSERWGLDHGAWQVLMHLLPMADVPVLQLSLARSFTVRRHLELAERLKPLRNDGVLILGSGNIVHNLGQLGHAAAPDWALEFDEAISDAIRREDIESILDYQSLPGAALAVPTPEHFWPLLYVLAVRQAGDELRFFTESFDFGSISMRSLMLA